MFGYINGFPFSTVDRDNDGINGFPPGLPPEVRERLGPDEFIKNCAEEVGGGGGWWYGRTSLPTFGGECFPGASLTAPFINEDGLRILELDYNVDHQSKHNRQFKITDIVMKVRRKHLLCRNIQPNAQKIELAAIQMKYPQLLDSMKKKRRWV